MILNFSSVSFQPLASLKCQNLLHWYKHYISQHLRTQQKCSDMTDFHLLTILHSHLLGKCAPYNLPLNLTIQWKLSSTDNLEIILYMQDQGILISKSYTTTAKTKAISLQKANKAGGSISFKHTFKSFCLLMKSYLQKFRAFF